MPLTPEHRPRWPRKGDPSNKVLPQDEDAKDRRTHERRKADRRSRIIDRCWLGVLTLLWIWAVLANQNRVDDIQSSRVQQTEQACVQINKVITGYNEGQDFLATLVVASTLLAGDKPQPKGEKDPLKWTGITEGPLSKSIEQRIPGYPNSDVRLAKAQDEAKRIQGKKLKSRDCNAAVGKVEKSGK